MGDILVEILLKITWNRDETPGLLLIWAAKHSAYSGLSSRKAFANHLPTQPSELVPGGFGLPVLLGAYCCREQLHRLAEQNQGKVASFAVLSPPAGWVSGAPSHLTIPSPRRVTTATTSCLPKRRSVCSSWRRPLAPWRLRLTVDSPRTSQSQPPVLEVSEHYPSPSRLPRVRDCLGWQLSEDQCLLLNTLPPRLPSAASS